jgi:chorismate dehydratase
LDPGWIHRFEDANTFGIQNISRVLDGLADNDFDLHTYFTQYLSYDLNEKKREGLELFLSMLKKKVLSA